MTDDGRRVPTLSGRAWTFADRLSAEEVLPARFAGLEPAAAAHHLFADLDAGLAGRLTRGDVLIAGHALGHGAGGTAAAMALAAAGMAAVVAASFADGFDEALMAAAIPPLVVDAPATFHTGHALRINVEAGTIADLSSGDRQPVRNLTDALLARLRDLIGR